MIQYKVGFFVCIFFGVMTGGLKNLFFFLFEYISTSLFKIYVCVWKTSTSHSLISLYRKPHHLDQTHRDLDKPHKAN